jgi:hypothetical protein
MVVVGINLMPPKVIGKKFIYKLKVLLGYQNIRNPRNA